MSLEVIVDPDEGVILMPWRHRLFWSSGVKLGFSSPRPLFLLDLAFLLDFDFGGSGFRRPDCNPEFSTGGFSHDFVTLAGC
jgi:hypothetical protein